MCADRADPRGAATLGPTPGPWRWECAENTKTITLKGGSRASAFGRYDMAVMTFRRWGMSGAQPHVLDTNDRGILCPMSVFAVEAPGREHHAAWFKLIDHPDARLIEQAWTIPALRDALAELNAALDAVRFTGTNEDITRCVLARREAAAVLAAHGPRRGETAGGRADG